MKANAANLGEIEITSLHWVLTSPARLVDWLAERVLDRLTLLVDLFLVDSDKTPRSSDHLNTTL